MDDTRFTSSPAVTKSVCSPANHNRQRTDSAAVIQQSDVSSSRPAMLAHDALGPLLFEALDGFFFTINHNFELDFVSDNVGQYLKFSQEELAGRSLYICVHPNDVGEFSKAWAKINTGDCSTTPVNSEEQNAQSRGRTFHCRMRTNDDSAPYVRMVVSVALHRDSVGSDKTFLICIVRRPSSNDPKDKPSVLGFDQFSSRINLNYDIKSFDSSHMKCETLDMNFHGKNFRDYVYAHDLPCVERHFQEVIEKGEGKSSVYRFRLHDDVYAFVNTRSKLFHNSTTAKSDSILSTHTIVRLTENSHDLNGNATTRLIKSVISSNRDLHRNSQPHQQCPQQTSSKTLTTSPTPPIGTQFALTMLGMHKNASNSLQQHVSSTLGTLLQVQNSFSASTTPNDKPRSQSSTPSPSPTPNRLHNQKSSTLDSVSSSDTVEFGSKRTPFSPSLISGHSNHGSLSSPVNSFDIFFPSSTPSNTNDLNSFFSSPVQAKTTPAFLSNQDTYTTSCNSKQTPSRSSTRLRQLLTNKSPSTNDTPSQILHYLPDTKIEDVIQGPESPTTTRISPLPNEFSVSPTKRQRKQASALNSQANSPDVLLKKLLGKQNSYNTSPMKPESSHSDDSSSSGNATNKQRSDIFLRTLLNDEVRPQKVVVETPFAFGSRQRNNQRSSSNAKMLLENNKTYPGLKSQLSLQTTHSSDLWENKNKKKHGRQYSNSFLDQNHHEMKKPGRPKREQTDYLFETPDCQTPLSNLSDTSLDALLDSSANLDESSPIVLRRTSRQTSATSLKRSSDNNDYLANSRKMPKLTNQEFKEEVKVEQQDRSINSTAMGRPLPHQTFHPIVKTEPQICDHNPLHVKPSLPSHTQLHRPALNNNRNSQSNLLRTLIRTPQHPPITTKKDAPLYDLLQDFDTTSSADTSLFDENPLLNNSMDPFEQYLTPVISQTSTPPLPAPPTSTISSLPTTTSTSLSSKDDYLAALLSSDPQQPNEITFVPPKQQQPQQISNDNTRITAIANDLLNSTKLSNNNPPNDDFLSLLENKEFLEILNDSTTIDSILSQNSAGLVDQTFPLQPPYLPPSSMTNHSEKDEKAISEIYKALVTSLKSDSSQQSTATTHNSIATDHSLFGSFTGDFLFGENTNSMPPNRTVNSDSLSSVYHQSSSPSLSTYPYSSNNAQYSDGLSMDLMENNGVFPPNITLSPINTSYPSQTSSTSTIMNPNPMMMYPQQSQSHLSHHPPPPPNVTYHQPPQQPMYNNYVQQPPSNQVPNGYYSMSPIQQQRMSPANHHSSQLTKRQSLIQQQQRTSSQMNSQQLQLHMSMNVTLPNMMQNQPQQQQQQQQQPPPQQQMAHRPMMNTYNDLMMPNNNGPPLQHHQYPNNHNNNSLDLPYSPDLFSSPSSTMGQQSVQNRHMNVNQHQQSLPTHPQATIHQPYSNMSVALSATIQQNTHNPNNLMNSSVPSLTSAECRQSEELNNQMMNCLSFQPTRRTSEFVRKQLQNTIQGRQKPVSGGKDLPGTTGHSPFSPNLDNNQKGAYFRSQLSSQMSTPPIPTNMRSQQQGKTT